MPKVILFSELNLQGETRIMQSNDNDLVVNGLDFAFQSAIVATANWTLFEEVGHSGPQIDLHFEGGPDLDGVYMDFAAWEGTMRFHVKSLYHDQ